MRPWEDFDGGEVSFIDYIRRRYPDNLEEVIDQRMKMTENMYEQAKQGISLGLMCIDRSTKLPSIDQILNIITRVYETSCEVESATHGRSHTVKGHKRFQSR